MVFNRATLGSASLLSIVFSFSFGAAAPPPQRVIEEIRAARLAPERAVPVESLQIDMGLATMYLESGLLIPAEPIGGRTLEMAFVGRAYFRLDPPDAIETHQLELFTRRERLDVEVRQAVLMMADEAIATRLLERPIRRDPDPQQLAEAQTLFSDWVEGAERRGFGAEAAIFKAVLGDAPSQAHFAIWCRTDTLGDFYYLLDPFEVEQASLGQFVEWDLDEIAKRRVDRAIRKRQRKGRSLQTRLANLGDWDTWVSASLSDDSGEPRPGSQGFKAQHYTLDVGIDSETRIDGSARIELRSTSAGRRSLSLSLFPDLTIRSIRDGEGNDLVWLRIGSQVHIALADEVQVAQEITLEIEFDGELLVEPMSGVYVNLDTYSWFPRIDTFDRATYDVTLRWPKKYELLASGRLVEEGEDGNRRWQRRRLDVPSFAFSFEYGNYDIHTTKAGHVDLTVGFSKLPSYWEKGAKEEVLKTLSNALVFLEENFGAYPLDYLTVATVPRGFSQGYLGFLTLAHPLVARPKAAGWINWGEEFDTIRAQYRDETIAHELSHQWWGNKIGWASYRDQWLSESLADFSAVQFVASDTPQSTAYLARHAVGWRNSINHRTEDGRTVESLGPVVLGHRLHSSFSDDAYSAVVYDKGSVVFSMLARILQPEPFTRMLGALADAAANRNIDTESFLKAIEKMSGVDLQEFADLFIYGTGVPEIYYNYKIKQDDAGWVVEGTARQIASGHFRYRLDQDADGRWNIRRERASATDISKRFFVVPFQIALSDGRDSASSEGFAWVERGLGGNLLLEGETTHFSIPTAERPRLFWFDQRGEVLAEFFAENHRPKRVMRYKAMELEGEEAEALYRQALNVPLYSEAGLAETEYSTKQIEYASRIEDANILFYLARLYLDQRRDEDARQAYEQAKKTLGRLDKNLFASRRMLLECRFAIREGRFKDAYGPLSKKLALEFDRTSEDTIFDAARRKKFRRGRWMRGDAYALLALAAHETGHDEVALAALEEAEERGADVSALRALM